MDQIRADMMDELTHNIMSVSTGDLDELAAAILTVKDTHNIFVYGRGREMMGISAFAFRLNQMGYHAYIVGEPHVPPIREGDLFLVTNGRNMLEAHAAQMRTAREERAKVIVLTAHPKGGFEKIPVDSMVVMYGQTLDDEIDFSGYYQTMGTPYEQALLVLLDCVAWKLTESSYI